jgi:PleD family two-component response regulator
VETLFPLLPPFDSLVLFLNYARFTLRQSTIVPNAVEGRTLAGLTEPVISIHWMMEQPAQLDFPICLAVGDRLLSSQLELTLSEAGYQVLAFTSAKQLWESFPTRRPRFIITERIFSDGFSALNLCRLVRQDYLLPYVYIYILSNRREKAEIEEALDAGANDYSIKPVSPFQIRTRVLVGLRWLAYIDSITMPSSH